jgi:poly-gamma-glutamate synthesis protein (capsule biosynthesis protein)
MSEPSQPKRQTRRSFLLTVGAAIALKNVFEKSQSSKMTNCITLFLCGDVMTGRGIDQILPHPSNPLLHEPYVKSAEEYVELARQANGSIPYPVNFSDIWGDALDEWERVAPDLRIINLETSITTSEDYWEEKDIHYRMNPANISCLTAAKIACCSLANNHVLDWGYAGLTETLKSLKGAKIESAGAGQNLKEAETPVEIEVEGKGRVIVFSLGLTTSGIPLSWGATQDRPGVNLLQDLSEETVRQIDDKIQKIKRSRDIIVASIHWGGNWGYEIDRYQTEFAHRLIEGAGVDLIHGHSSHHVKGIEVYQDKLILYGCGDFLNDYEGVTGYEAFKDDLGLMYFARIDPLTGKLVSLQMTPTQIKHLRVNRASLPDALWLRDILNREGKRLGTQVELNPDRTLTLQWR